MIISLGQFQFFIGLTLCFIYCKDAAVWKEINFLPAWKFFIANGIVYKSISPNQMARTSVHVFESIHLPSPVSL